MQGLLSPGMQLPEAVDELPNKPNPTPIIHSLHNGRPFLYVLFDKVHGKKQMQ